MLFICNLLRIRRSQLNLNHRRIDIRRRQKTAPRNRKQLCNRSIILHRNRNCSGFSCSNWSGQLLCNFFLHHNRNCFQLCPTLQQVHENRSGDIIRQVRTNRNRHGSELLFQQCWNVTFQNVLMNDMQVFILSNGFLQNREQPCIYFHSRYFFCTLGKLCGQCSDSRANFQNAMFRLGVAHLGNARANIRIDEKVLSQLLREVKSMPFQ